ncbi:MAG TPA: endonuclease/exonuclease/phosphatase family protein [Micromonosporaceae bacterium]|nr:endonuclease/exonuclease/phosphatase family protein [Micromonosporaceae bacterium]
MVRPRYGWLLIGVATSWLVYNAVRRAATGRWHWSILLDAVPPLFLVAIPLLLLAASAAADGRRRRLAAVIALVGVLPGIDQTGVNLHALRWAAQPVPVGAVHVFTWNTNYWGMANADKEAQVRFLKGQQADIYLLQEHVIRVPGTGEEGYHPVDDDARLRAEFPGYHIARRGELLTISRYPIVSQPVFGPAARLPPGAPFHQVFARDKVLRTDLRIAGRTASVYNLHITAQAAVDLSLISGDTNLDRYYRTKFDLRQAEVKGLVDDVAANPNPVLVSGDLNCTSAMGCLGPLRAVARDATRANRQLLPLSWRFGAPRTFRQDNALAGLPMPFWRIDWTFTRGPVTVHRYKLVSVQRLSDHRAQDLWISVA